MTDEPVPAGAMNAAHAWCRAVYYGDFPAVWALLTDKCRRNEAAGWVDRNADDLIVGLYDQDQVAEDLARLESDHRLRDRMEAELVVGYLGSLPDDTSPDDWATPQIRRLTADGLDIVGVVDRRRVPEKMTADSLLAPEVYVNIVMQDTSSGWKVARWSRHPSLRGDV